MKKVKNRIILKLKSFFTHLDCLTLLLVVDWLDDVLTVHVVQVNVVLLEVQVVQVDLVQIVLTEDVFVVMVVVNDLLVLVVIVDDLLGGSGVGLEGLDFVGWNDLLSVVVVLADLSWADGVSGATVDDFLWCSVHCGCGVDWSSSVNWGWSSVDWGGWGCVHRSGGGWGSVDCGWRSVLCWRLGHHSGCLRKAIRF